MFDEDVNNGFTFNRLHSTKFVNKQLHNQLVGFPGYKRRTIKTLTMGYIYARIAFFVSFTANYNRYHKVIYSKIH